MAETVQIAVEESGPVEVSANNPPDLRVNDWIAAVYNDQWFPGIVQIALH